MTAEWSYAGAGPGAGDTTTRKRGMVRLVLGTALTGIGLAATIVGAIETASDSSRAIDNAVGAAQVPGGTVTFQSTGGDYTIFLLTPGRFTNSDEVERQVASTECAVEYADGGDSTIRGSRQASSVTTDAGATVGWFTAVPGPTTVTCEYVRGGRSPHDFVVAPGKPEVFGEAQIQLFGGIVALVAGIFLVIWGWRGGKTVVTSAS